jgi:hypothetical protein
MPSTFNCRVCGAFRDSVVLTDLEPGSCCWEQERGFGHIHVKFPIEGLNDDAMIVYDSKGVPCLYFDKWSSHCKERGEPKTVEEFDELLSEILYQI